MTQKINPKLVKTWHQKFLDRARGTKFYRTGFELPGGISKFSSAIFKTASQAELYGTLVLLRWQSLYEAALVQDLTVPEAAETVNG